MTFAATPYEPQRRRLRLMEAIECLRLGGVEAARGALERVTALTPAQQVNIRKGRLKTLAGDIERRIDRAFVGLARRQIRTLRHEMALAHASARGVDPGVVADAQASIAALEGLIAEAGVVANTLGDDAR